MRATGHESSGEDAQTVPNDNARPHRRTILGISGGFVLFVAQTKDEPRTARCLTMDFGPDFLQLVGQ